MSFSQTSAGTEPYAYGTGVLTVNMKSPATLGPGVYSDLITLSICYDSACTKPAVGTPYKIPVTYTVTASAGQEFQQQIIQQNLTALAVDPTGTLARGLGSGVQLQPGGAGQAGFDYGGLQLAGGLLYSGGGQVLNPVTNTILGQYTLPGGVPAAAFTIDTANNRTFATFTATVNDADEGTIQSYNLTTFSPIWIARLPIGTQPLRWGSNGLAWLEPSATAGVQALYLINGTFVAP